MSTLTRRRAAEIASRFGAARILVVGDLMLDRFVWGEVSRISPEAPVPVVRIRGESSTLGGAGNVVSNVSALGGSVRCVGVIGDDAPGRVVRGRLADTGAAVEGLVAAENRTTTLKTRVIAHGQQVVRVDREEDAPIPAEVESRLVANALGALGDVAGVVVSDYDKGSIGRALLERLLPAARSRGLPVVVDPKLTHFTLYQPASVLTPNQSEAARATAIEIRNDDDLARAGRKILDMLDIESLLITRGEKGMRLIERTGDGADIPARAREVYDVTGAGDTVVAALVLSLAAGATLREAAELSNAAAGVVVSKLGTATASASEVIDAMDASIDAGNEA